MINGRIGLKEYIVNSKHLVKTLDEQMNKYDCVVQYEQSTCLSISLL